MKRVQEGFAGNFGLVGKGVRRYLATTALTATGLLAAMSPALADNDWSDHVAVKGSIVITKPAPNITNIKQNTSFAKVKGDGDIAAGNTVNIDQPSSNSKYVVYDTENDPSYISGNLNANGEVYIFDQNGVIFNQGSQVNVGSIITSTGFISDANIKANKLVFENVGGTGEIALNGTISVADAGLAAFVGPTVTNSGVINAKLGKVVLASGEKVTLDLYGDDLVSVTVDGALGNALVQNKGTIKAEGGHVVLTAAAAKEAVDNVINMDGVIDVSSVSMKGGKIVLSGGNKGVVKVSGKAKANGTSGGNVKIIGQNVILDGTSEVSADATVAGNGGKIYVYGSDNAVMGGLASVRGGALSGNGGFVELSAMNAVGFNGLVDASATNGETGTFLIDPATINLGNFAPLDFGTLTNLKIDAQALANTLRLAHTHLWATDRIFTSDNIDLSRWSAFGFSGITNKNLTLSADTIDFLHDVTLGTGKLIIKDALTTDSVFGFGLVTPPSDILVKEVNLDGKIYTRSSLAQPAFTTLAGDAQINSNANLVNVLSDDASIQQGVWFANDAGGAVVNAAAGHYYESILINKGLTLNGANKGIEADSAGRVSETWIHKNPAEVPTPNAITITASNVTIDGILALQFKRGISAENVSNINILNNRIATALDQGIFLNSITNLDVSGNKIDATGNRDAAIHVANSAGTVNINRNVIGKVYGTNGDGIYLFNTDNASIQGNNIRIVDTTWNTSLWNDTTGVGIRVLDSNDATVSGNTVTNTKREGILIDNSDDAIVSGNLVNKTEKDGIAALNGSDNVTIENNVVGYTTLAATTDAGENNIYGDGILVDGSAGAIVKGNKVTQAHEITDKKGSGIHVLNSQYVDIGDNVITNSRWDAIRTASLYDAFIHGNYGNNQGRVGVYAESMALGTISGNTMLYSNVSGGIEVIYSTDVNVLNNTVLHSAETGILVKDSAGIIRVAGNTVDDTGYLKRLVDGENSGDGIRIVNVAGTADGDDEDTLNDSGVIVDGNFVGTNEGAANIRGNGVAIIDSPYAVVSGNTITNTTENGVFVDPSPATVVSGNIINNTGLNGVYILDSNDSRVLNNEIGLLGGAHNINGDGVLVYTSNGVWVKGNKITNTTSTANDIGSGVQLLYSENAIVGGEGDERNTIYNTGWDGVRVGDFSNNVQVLNNDIDNVHRTGVYLKYLLGALVQGNEIDGTETHYGVHADGGMNIDVIDNDIDNTELDGVFSESTVNILVDGNNIGQKEGSVIGANGINVLKPYGSINVLNNFVSNTVQNGIKVGGVEDGNTQDFINVLDNTVDLAGYDGIHVHYFNGALIQGNDISRSGDDGIEAHDGADVEIDGNEVSESGIGTIIDEEDPEVYDGFDEFNGGHDGISVRRMQGQYTEFEGEIYYKLFDYDSNPASVRITNNKVSEGSDQARILSGGGISVSGDDGIEVVDVNGYVYINNNSVENSGTDGETSYGEADEYGADGIHVRNVFSDGSFYDVVREGDVGNGEYNIVVANNTVNNSLDDGIEILGSYGLSTSKASIMADEYDYDYFGYGNTQRVLVQDNTVSNSGWGNPANGFGQADYTGFGGDGIRVEGINPDGGYAVGLSEEGEYAGYAVDILHNTVTNSGDDGIEVIYSNSTLIDDNTVKNSGLIVTGEGGFNTADGYGSDGIFVNNVGYEYYYGGDSRLSIFAEPLVEGYTPYSVVIRRNDVDNSKDDGIQVNNDMWQDYTAPVLVDINENVSNSGSHGLYISGPSHNNVIVSGNNFSNFDIGAEFESGLIDLTGVGNTFTNGNVGLRFAPYMFEGEGGSYFANLNLVDNDGPGSTPYPTTPTNFGGTIGEQIFTGFTEAGKFYVYLAEGAFTNDGTPIWLNGLNSTYDGLRPSTTGGVLTEAQYDYLEQRFQHFPDDSTTDIFWFGFVPEVADGINQNLIFNRFANFNGDITGLNVLITGLPNLPGEGGGAPGPAAFNNITTFAGGDNNTNPSELNQISTAAGGDATTPEALNNIGTESGNNDGCWSSAMNSAGAGQAVNVTYNGSFADNLNQAANCGGTF